MKRTPLKRGKPLERRTPLRTKTPLRPRSKRPRKSATISWRYRAWIRTQPCLCGDAHVCIGIIESHHQPLPGQATVARRNDFRAVPLCTEAHAQYHRDRDRFANHGVDIERAIVRLNRLYEISTGRQAA